MDGSLKPSFLGYLRDYNACDSIYYSVYAIKQPDCTVYKRNKICSLSHSLGVEKHMLKFAIKVFPGYIIQQC